MIEIQDIQVVFFAGEVLENRALNGINLNINQGEFITIIGSNGSGKSTLLNVLSGDVVATKGTILLNKLAIEKLPVYKRAKFISRVFQDPLLGSCANLTIKENMALALNRGRGNKLKFANSNRSNDLFRQQLARLNLCLENRLDDKINRLSGGQRQAISLLMASLRPSNLLLLDEHTAALDPKTASKVLSLSCELISENKLTTLMVTHSMQQALSVGTRTIMLHQGKIVFDVSGTERQQMQVQNLLDLFSKNQGEEISDDKLLFS